MARPPLALGTWGRISRTREAPGRWVASARFRNATGDTVRVRRWRATGAQAERALVAAFKQITASGGDDLGPTTRLRDLADYWFRTQIEPSDRAYNTKERYAQTIKNQIKPGVGGLMLREATTASMDRFLQAVVKKHGEETASGCRTVLSGMLGLAARFDVIPANPVREVTRITPKKQEVKALTDQQVRLLRQQLAEDKKALRGDLPDVIGVMLATGCRVGEAIAVRWDDIDLEAGTLTITGKVIRKKQVGIVREDTAKGKKTTRLHLPDWAVEMLQARAQRKLPGGADNLVFPTVNATPREVRTIEHQWMAFRTRHPEWAGITTRQFRKTVGTATARALGAEAAAQQLAHSDPALTRERYIEKPDEGPDVRAALKGFRVQSGQFPVTSNPLTANRQPAHSL
jgi:integrase